MKKIWLLFIEFFLIGTFSVGGGLATLPYIINLAGKYDWYTVAELMDMVAISESTPGPIGINMATYVGYSVDGILGSLMASMGVMLTGVLFMMIVGQQLEKFRDSVWLNKVFYGLRPTIAALIAFAGYTMIVSIAGAEPNVLTSILLFVVSLVMITRFKVSPILMIGIAALSSIVIPF